MNSKINFTLFEELLDDSKDIFPKILYGLLFIIASWIIFKIVMYILKKSLKFTKIDKLTEKLNETPLFSSEIKIDLEKIILIFAKWFLIFVFIILGSDLLGLNFISGELGRILNYLPKVFTALVIFVLGIYGAGYVKKSLRSLLKAIDINGSKAISNIVFIILTVFVSVISLNQAGLNTDIITNNLFLILGALLAAFAISFGLGSRDIVYRLLLSFYIKRNLAVGQKIIIDEQEAVITAIQGINFVVRIDGKKIVYPIKYLANKKIELLN